MTFRRVVILLVILSPLVSGCSFIFPRDTVKYILYPVSSGDTVYGISHRFNVSVGEILDINDIDDARELQIGVVLRVPYRGQDLGREAQAASKPTERPKAGAADIKRVELTAAKKFIGRLKWPVAAGEVSSRFGWRWFSFHEGIDIGAREGTPIYAAHDGVVVYSGNGLSGYGNLIILKDDGLLTVYGHNRKNLVRKGERVRRGEKIAEVGQTGKATGPHLHFETRVKAQGGGMQAVDPLAFYP